MNKKQAFAVIFYAKRASSVFTDTFVDFAMFDPKKERISVSWMEDIYEAIMYQDDFYNNLLKLSREKLKIKDKDVSGYNKLLKTLKVDKLTLQIVKDAGDTLVQAMGIDKKEVDRISYILE